MSATSPPPPISQTLWEEVRSSALLFALAVLVTAGTTGVIAAFAWVG